MKSTVYKILIFFTLCQIYSFSHLYLKMNLKQITKNKIISFERIFQTQKPNIKKLFQMNDNLE